MNVNILKALTMPNMVSDAELSVLTPRMASLVGDLCMGSDLSNPIMRIGGINVADDDGDGCVALTNPADGNPVLYVRSYMDGTDVMYGVQAMHTHLLERGGNRHTVESKRIPYIVNKVRSRIGAVLKMSGRGPSMFNSAVNQIVSHYQKDYVSSSTMTVEASLLFGILESIQQNLPINTQMVADLSEKAGKVMNSRSIAAKQLEENFVKRKWWFVTNHNDYGFMLQTVEAEPSLRAADILSGRVSNLNVHSMMKFDTLGWFKSLDHMQRLNPDLYTEFYTQLVFTKQIYESNPVPHDGYMTDVPHNFRSMSGENVVRHSPLHHLMLPRSDFYHEGAALASWVYSNCNAKTASYALLERVV